jgi:hypothetical protein
MTLVGELVLAKTTVSAGRGIIVTQFGDFCDMFGGYGARDDARRNRRPERTVTQNWTRPLATTFVKN